ncbi:MAG: Zn-dependent membrane-bound protease, M50 family protein [Candidatus Saccharibacteria bacterium GW2011_GWC2_48_9]|nr:MAG: Zn-dependent membrane-bound protease, M50 family protein [Candidatus Saccharibacteria bacterium GW2011_GWC2_48_9]HCH34496.1 zinc metalloprotease ywhC [Candidatus Saccharibacteria bacterium]
MDDVVLRVIVTVGVVLVSMTIHEAMHGFMAHWLGDDTAKDEGRLTLNPIKHIDPFLTILLPVMLAVVGGPIFGGAKPVPFNPARVRYEEFGAALVALAGPLVNLLFAFLSFVALVLLDPALGSLTGYILSLAVQINLGFFVFNMLPIPPLDGSRVLYALAPEFIRRAMEVFEQAGLLIVFALVLFAGSFLGSIMTSAIDAILGVFRLLLGV